ncbi:MAG: c-type cytochrome [Thermodesulfobacteriota bacterium]
MTFHKKGKEIFLTGVSALFLMSVLSFIGTGEVKAEEAGPGKALYGKYCAACHGEKGDAKGAVCSSTTVEKSGRSITTFSRDFTLGVFKFRTTSTGCLPDDTDLMATIDNGIPKSFMPSFADLPTQEKKDIIAYLQEFSERWFEEDPCDLIAINIPSYVGSPESIEKGKQVYKDMKCWECHGETGKGDGSKSAELKDDWGHKIVPFDFTSGDLKRGTSPEAVYITFSSGLDGSGMPSYEDTLKEEDRWHIVSYTLKLMGK